MIISNLTQTYKDTKVLNIKNLKIDEATITSLMGSNGSGKSTLLKIIANVEEPKTGTIKSKLTPKDISILFPEPVLLKRNVRKNFIFALRSAGLLDEFNERVSEALSLVGLDDSFLDKDHYALSSGQTQRVAFAIILALRTKLILLDEPTSSVDLSTAKLFSKAIEYIHKKYNCGFIIASHDEKWLSAIAKDSIFLYGGIVGEFEFKNVFNVEGGDINFGDDLRISLPNQDEDPKYVAIDLEKIKLSKTREYGYYKGILHSISIIYETKLLIKIKFGDYLLKSIINLDDNFKKSPYITGETVYFKIDDSAYFTLC
ncbi:tungsten ABC transporter TupABC, ATP-binding protein [Campylobacter blaseri]|uniref:Tungsten ABC transporter ATP-binding protein n=1 Tax=Campylobacter blaseri TaxID=2042961 RepID=A0A2P8QZ31_9BACT|nr:tungstate ABC transporter ATP-binding protein TupC [Campylobacter blaseri]PSM51506.1 tungsten ABC transporter ATP-binding protein [Campylobacter blaseri]PSM52955.1 tungsten ABC transporter ATP-binding protein [Campylobacter blaseri]QKF86483.1 tungsten ABC transporter TupABC, ATP-binding protein [Campylobacter blaseri]